MLAADVAGDVVHGAGPVEGDHGDDVLEAVGLEPAQHVAHAAAFELEDPHRFGAAQHFVGERVVEGDGGEVHRDLLLAQGLHRPRQNRQCLEAEEIEFHQPRHFHVFHGELGHRRLRTGIAVERHQFIERAVTDDHPGGMGGGMAVEAFQGDGEIHHARDGDILGLGLGELGLGFDGLGQGHGIGGIVGHQLADAVYLAVGHLQHPAHVAQRRARLQRPEGDDLGHMVRAVFVLDVVD